jgi:hypothetical protein
LPILVDDMEKPFARSDLREEVPNLAVAPEFAAIRGTAILWGTVPGVMVPKFVRNLLSIVGPLQSAQTSISGEDLTPRCR